MSRAATIHLRAHPFLSYQRDPSLASILYNTFAASVVTLVSKTPRAAACVLHRELSSLSRAVDDARALTRSPELSDTLGRSQVELRQLLASVQVTQSSSPVVQSAAVSAAAHSPALVSESPYLAL